MDSVCLVDEQNGRLVYVKRNLTLLRLWGRRSCRSNYNRFDVATPKSLEIGKNSQHRQTNNDNQHQHSSGSRNAGRFRFFSHRFWQIQPQYPSEQSRSQAASELQSRCSAPIAFMTRSPSRAYRFFPPASRSAALKKIGSPMTMVIGAHRKRPPSRGSAS